MQLLCLHQLNWNFSELNPTLYHICILRLCPMVLHFVFLYQLLCECSSGARSSGSNWSKNFILHFVHQLVVVVDTIIYCSTSAERCTCRSWSQNSVLNLLQGYLTIQRFRDKKLSRHHFWKALHFFIEVGNSLKTNHDRKSRRPYLWRRSLLQSDIMAVSSGPIRIKDIIEGRPTSSRTDSSKSVLIQFVTGSF